MDYKVAAAEGNDKSNLINYYKNWFRRMGLFHGETPSVFCVSRLCVERRPFPLNVSRLGHCHKIFVGPKKTAKIITGFWN
jgi:hypothetical protein